MKTKVEDFSKLNYQSQLNHPLWKEKRNYIVNQRGNECERCGSKEHLQVHHIKYLKGKLAWEYEDNLLECLCGICHMKEHDIDKTKEKQEWLLDNSMNYIDMDEIVKTKFIICLNLNNEVVNKVINTLELRSYNGSRMYFKNYDLKITNYLLKLFPDKVVKKQGEIGFIIKKCVKSTDIMSLDKICRKIKD